MCLNLWLITTREWNERQRSELKRKGKHMHNKYVPNRIVMMVAINETSAKD